MPSSPQKVSAAEHTRSCAGLVDLVWGDSTGVVSCGTSSTNGSHQKTSSRRSDRWELDPRLREQDDSIVKQKSRDPAKVESWVQIPVESLSPQGGVATERLAGPKD